MPYSHDNRFPEDRAAGVLFLTAAFTVFVLAMVGIYLFIWR